MKLEVANINSNIITRKPVKNIYENISVYWPAAAGIAIGLG